MSALLEPAATRRKAREIIDANPGATLVEVVALAYLEGRVAGLRSVKDAARPGLHEFDAICQRCGQRDGSRSVVDADAPKDGFFRTVCFHCSAGDDPRAA